MSGSSGSIETQLTTVERAGAEQAAEAHEAAVAPRLPLRHRVMRSSFWTGLEYGVGQALRFGGHLVLAYLLVPRMFGLMAVVNVCIQGLEMLSDVGLAPSIIQSERGLERRFLNTAWTLQILRGIVLWTLACVLAWPMAALYNEQLILLLPVAALSVVLRGFTSTKWYTQNRALLLGRRTVITIGSKAAMIGLMILWAWYTPTVWALVGGAVIGAGLEMIGSHLVLPGATNRVELDRSSLHEIYRFGRWIAISTALAFGARHIETLMFGKLFGATALGVFWVALQIARVGPEFMQRLGQYVGFPALAELYREDFAQFRRRLLHLRVITVVPLNLAMLTLIGFGPMLIELIYPNAYHNASWMLAAMATTSLAGMVNDGYGNAYLAMGRSFDLMLMIAAQITMTVICTLIGYTQAGSVGFLVGSAFAHWFVYPINAAIADRVGIWQPELDLPVLAGSGVTGFYLLFTWLG